MNCAVATAGLYVCTLTYLHTIVDYFLTFKFQSTAPYMLRSGAIGEEELAYANSIFQYFTILLFISFFEITT